MKATSGSSNRCACSCVRTSSRACRLRSHRRESDQSRACGQIRHAFFIAGGKKRQEQSIQGRTVEQGRSDCRETWHRDFTRQLAHRDLRLSCGQQEEAWRDVEASIGRDMEYFVSIGLKGPYEAYPGQPANEITARSGADRRDWIIGTPDDAIEQIERMQAETGGFGGLMLTTHEWTGTEKVRRSMDCSRATSCRTFAAIPRLSRRMAAHPAG